MTDQKRVPREQWPGWIKVGVIGSGSRTALWAWAALSLAAGAALFAFSLLVGDVYWAIGGLIGGPAAALMYWLTIRWIDRHGSWAEL